MIIRGFKDNDFFGLKGLDETLTTNNNTRSLPNWEWKYRGGNPFGHAIMSVCEDKDKIVAHFAIMPMNYYINGKYVSGAHSLGAMVSPEFQSRGLIKYVADKAIEESNKNNIQFIYGYPNEAAYKLHTEFLGYEDIQMQDEFVCQKTNRKSIIDKPDLVFKSISIFKDDVNQLWEEACGDYKALVKRSADFLNWRYCERPDSRYHCFGAYVESKLVGYCVLKLFQDENITRGHFIDIFTSYNDLPCFQFLIQKGLDFLFKEKCSETTLWLNGHQMFRQELSKAGFEITSSRPLICRFNTEMPEIKNNLNAVNWYFTMGDTLEIY